MEAAHDPEIERAREAGALTAIPLALSMLSYIHATSGELAAAESLLDEIGAASEATGTPAPPYLPLWIAALRGREAETRDLIRSAGDDAAARGEGYATFVTEHVTAVLYNGLGRYGPGACRASSPGCRSVIQGWFPRGRWRS